MAGLTIYKCVADHNHNSGSILLIIIILLANTISCAQGSWERIPLPTANNLNSVCFTDSLYGWVAGDSGIILHTTDGGNNWQQQDTHTTGEIADVFFLDRILGWASAYNYTTAPYGTILLKTTDGGATWVSQPYPDENIFMTCILFRDSLHGWMGGKPHALVRTNDGGITWSQAHIDSSILAFFPVLGIQFYNDRYGYASGGMFDIAGVTWHTSDGGDTWFAIDPAEAPADEVHGLHMFDSIHVMGAGGDPDFAYGVGMIRTSDGGLHWTYDALNIQGNAFDLDFRNDREAWAPLGSRQKLICSMDAGVSWTPVVTPDSTSIFEMTFPDSLHGYAVGRNGAFIKYHLQSAPFVQPVLPALSGFVLLQNYPNPATSGTILGFVVPPANRDAGHTSGQGSLQLKIFDSQGREMACPVNGIPVPGAHEITLQAGSLPPGIYFYLLQLSTPGYTRTVAGPLRMVIPE